MLPLDAEIVNGDDVWMEKPGCRASFLMESRVHVSLFNQVGPNYFYSDWPVKRFIDTGIHRPHAPAAYVPLQPVTLRQQSRHIHTNQSGTILSAHSLTGL